MRKKQRLKILLKILISLFIIFGAAAILLAGIRKTRIEARQKQEAMEALKNVPTAAPTVSVTPSPSFTMVPEFSCPRSFGSGVGVCPSL